MRVAIRFAGIMLIPFLAGALLLGSAPAANAQPIEMKFAHYADEAHPAHQAAKQFAANVEKRTNGQVKIVIFPANALGSPPEQCEQVKLGAIDMNIPTQGQFEKYVRACMTAQIPFIFDSYEMAHKVLDGPAFDWLAQLAEKEGFIILSNWEWGFREHHEQQGRDQQARGCEGPETARPAGNASPGDHGGAGRGGDQDRLPRSLHGAGAERGGWAGEPPVHHLLSEVLRGPEASRPDTAHLQLHDPRGQPQEMGHADPGAAEDRARGVQGRRAIHARHRRRARRRTSSPKWKPPA